MNKYYGTVGFGITTETAPDVWKTQITERNYQGEIFKINRKLVSSENLNDDVTVSNRISILADPFAYNNFHSIRYITWMGTKWKVSNVEVSYPRLIFDLGGVYNGETGPKQGTP